MFSHPYCVGNDNDDVSSEEHFENKKVKKDSYLYLELLIFVHKIRGLCLHF
jgi:hypothetical protein